MKATITALILLLSIFPAQASSNFTITGGYDTNPKELEVAAASPYLDLTATFKHSFGSWHNSFKKVQVYLSSTLYSALPEQNNTYGSFRFERRPASDFRQKLTVGGSFSQNNYLSWGAEGSYYDSITANCSWEKKFSSATPTFGFNYSQYTYKEPYSNLSQVATRPFVGLSYALKPFSLYCEYQAGKVSYLNLDKTLSKPSLALKLTGGKAAAGWQLVGRKQPEGEEIHGNLWRELGDIYLDFTAGKQSRRGDSTGYQYDSLWGEASSWWPVGNRGWLAFALSLTSTEYLATPSWEREGELDLSYQLPIKNYSAKFGYKYSYRQGAGADALPSSQGSRIEFSIRK